MMPFFNHFFYQEQPPPHSRKSLFFPEICDKITAKKLNKSFWIANNPSNKLSKFRNGIILDNDGSKGTPPVKKDVFFRALPKLPSREASQFEQAGPLFFDVQNKVLCIWRNKVVDMMIVMNDGSYSQILTDTSGKWESNWEENNISNFERRIILNSLYPV